MRINPIALCFTVFFTSATCYASQINSDKLHEDREAIAKQYIQDLQNADYKHIIQLFEKNGIVISTSRGKANAKEFFSSFLPNVVWAKTQLHQFFRSEKDVNRVSARFHLSYKLKDGDEGNGEYMDEFVFTDNSIKLSAVYMFENLKFEN